MSCNTTDDVRIIMKYSTISGATPSIPLSDNHEDGTWLPTDLYIGEFFTNAADDTFWIRTDNGISQLFGGTGGSASFIGDFVHISGGTFSGVVYAPTFSANYLVGTTINGTTITADYFIGGTYSGDGSLLTGIVSDWLGGTISNPSYFTNTVDFSNTVSFDGLIQTNNIEFSFDNNININGYASASIFYGDGSGLTNLPTGTYSDTFTIGATLSSNTIIFSRNDGGDYNIDLTPILNQQSIATITWDDTIDELLITFNDASTIGLTINNFSQVSSTGPITAPEFYGGVFYGEFVGTYSNDIYTLTADLIGTEQIFTRTDGSTYSTDLSSLSGGGGGTQSLEQTLNIGNVSGSQSIIMNKGYGVYSIENQQTGVTLIDSGVVRVIATDGILPFPTDEAYIDVQGNGNIGLEGTGTLDINFDSVSVMGGLSFSGIQYVNDYSADYTNRSLVDKEYVDNAVGASSTLEQTLILGNTTGTQSIFISSSASQIQGYNGINQHWYDAGAPFVVLGDYYQIENNSGGGETQSYIRFYDEGDTMIENNEKYDTINSPANQDAKKTRLWLRPQTIRFNADNQDFDTNTFNLGSEMTINADAFTHETHDVLNDCTAQIVASTDGTGTYTAVSLQAYHYGGASASKVIVAHDYITNRVDANVGTGTGPFTLIEQTYTDIIVSGTTSFVGITYDTDYSSNYTNRSLVDKEYVDNASGSFVYITENTTTGTLTMSAPTSITSTVTDGTIINEDYNGLDYSKKSYNDGLYTSELIFDPLGNWDQTMIGEKYTGGGTESSIRFGSGGSNMNISTTDGSSFNLNTDYDLTNTQIINNVSDAGYGMASSKAIRTNPQGNIHQTMFSNNTSVQIIEDKKGYWTQTSGATTTVIAYTDVDPFIIGAYTASVVQVKAKVRGILDDKTLGYAAEIISWVRLNVGSITQIGTVDYTIKSEFTTAASSFVISGPNMYIDVTGEAGSTIDWTCSLEIIYDVNAL